MALSTSDSVAFFHTLLHQIFLPPRLPQKEDATGVDHALVQCTLDALTAFRDTLDAGDPARPATETAVTSLRLAQSCSALDGSLDVPELAGTLNSLCPGQHLPLHIKSQNAGLLISKRRDHTVFEAFELAPHNEAVMSTKGRLTRQFPGSAVIVAASTFDSEDFQTTLSHTLATMSSQAAPGMQPQVRKGHAFIDEDRDTTCPAMVTEFLLGGILKAYGSRANTSTIQKHTRDDVLWEEGAAKPWRRSPMWMLIRVSLQLIFSRYHNGSSSMYKAFMAFMMAHFLATARRPELNVSAELQYAMSCKVARRLQKLGSTVPQWIQVLLHKTQAQYSAQMAKLWESIQISEPDVCSQLHRLVRLDFGKDRTLFLPHLDSHLSLRSSRPAGSRVSSFKPRSEITTHEPILFPYLPAEPSDQYQIANLQAFEDWVEKHLTLAASAHPVEDVCCSLLELISSYHERAKKQFLASKQGDTQTPGNPEGLSVMILTIMEMWIALDKRATEESALLAEYDPQIPVEMLQCLILPTRSQMRRLLAVEDYLKSRKQAATRTPSKFLFGDPKDTQSFAAQYFDQSPTLIALRDEIVADAYAAKEKKIEELNRAIKTYELVKQEAEAKEHQYEPIPLTSSNHTRRQLPMLRHDPRCEKCRLDNGAEKMKIQVEEWPLPTNVAQTKSVIFELNIPSWYSDWRDSTYCLLRDVLDMQNKGVEKPENQFPLSEDPHLSDLYTAGAQRVVMWTKNKPHAGTHRRRVLVSTADERRVAPVNATDYQYLDTESEYFLEEFHLPEAPLKDCMYSLPPRAGALQTFLYRPAQSPNGRSSNFLIANQSQCPSHMTIEEYRELCTIPIGYQLQWYNILLQLAVPTVDFRKEETVLVFLQCIGQAGVASHNPSPDVTRASHFILNHADFACKLIHNLDGALARVKESWESMNALVVFSVIASRLLTISASRRTQEDCLQFLQKVRAAAFKWLTTLRSKQQHCEDEKERAHLLSKSIEVALICALTFDVDTQHLVPLLAIESEASILLQCSLCIAERRKGKLSLLGILDTRFRRVLYASCRTLQATHSGVDSAIKAVWNAYQPGSSGWRSVSDDVEYWLERTVEASSGTGTMLVHFNLLTGEFYVDGVPNKAPPLVYQEHPTYKALFGSCPVEVLPSCEANMSFSAKAAYGDCRIQLGMTPKSPVNNPRDLLVQADCNDGCFEILPSRLLQDELPESLVQEYVHWYNVTDGSVYFRPASNPWRTSESDWVLSRAMGSGGWHLTKEEHHIIGLRSDTAQEVARVLSPLASPENIEIILRPSQSALDIEVPTLKLGFSLKLGSTEIQSKEYRNMSIDADQSVGTLVGLRSKLTLKSTKSTKDDKRLLLVLEGEVSYVKRGEHVIVDVTEGQKVHPLEVDQRLGRLVDNGSIQSKLYLAYLHALTSFPLVDSLTKKTGTEQAISILHSAAVRSFEELSQPNVDLLKRISILTPSRCFYPKDAKVMQSVTWDPELGFMAQHGGFHQAVEAIFDQARRSKIFYPGTQLDIPSKVTDDYQHLLNRDLTRTAFCRASGFGAELHTTAQDVRYRARDQEQCSDRSSDAYHIAKMILTRSDKVHPDFCANLNLWGEIEKLSTLNGSTHPLDQGSLGYDALLIQESKSSVLPHLMSLHATLSKSNGHQTDHSALITWLATMSLAENAQFDIIQLIPMFLSSRKLRELEPPKVDRFVPHAGTDVSLDKLKEVIAPAAVDIESTPVGQSPLEPTVYGRLESEAEWRLRCEDKYQKKVHEAVRVLALDFNKQWKNSPSLAPEVPATMLKPSCFDYIDCKLAMKKVREIFKACRNNRLLKQFLERMEDEMAQLQKRSEPVPFWILTPSDEPHSQPAHVTVDDVFADRVLPGAFDRIDPPPLLVLKKVARPDAQPSECNLRSMIQALEESSTEGYQKHYISELRKSMDSLELQAPMHETSTEMPKQDELESFKVNCESHLSFIYAALNRKATAELEVRSSGRERLQWPRVSPTMFLEQLAGSRWQSLSKKWKMAIVQYGQAITAVQRAERLLTAFHSDNLDDFQRELRNPGHMNWDPLDHPESLLLEVEGGIMIRDVQEDIACEMRSPSSGGNQVLQLNMGEGKSSVIVPMVAAALGNGKQLVRVVVAKPQSKQMAQMLVSKLGGLLHRRIYFMPYSRALRLEKPAAQAIEKLCRECMREGGVLLVQPEHILSFALTGPESYVAGNTDVGKIFLRIQDFFDTCSRDIIDESDENFNVRFELVYTMGMRRPVELAPSRWGFIQQLLQLVRKHAVSLAEEHPHAVEIHGREEGGFPRIRVLQENIARLLVQYVATDMCENGICGLPISRQPPAVRATVLTYITKPDVTSDEADAVEKGPFWSDHSKTALLLTRGLLAGGILEFAFHTKRWRVNYGLTTRTPATRLAVPYRAKDSPSPRSEYSHPDVVILLTCLSYYYDGLADEDLLTALGHLMTSDQAEQEYQVWIADIHMPVMFQQLNNINIKDREQCISQVFPPLRFSKGVIDYFLSHVVFTRELKEYPHKLSASGCDLGRKKTLPTTGFSGTNDSRAVLPLDVQQIDLDKQKHTNALVLDYLMHSENAVKLMPFNSQASISDAEQLLSIVIGMNPQPEVILDVGAQILELDNYNVARNWLLGLNASSTKEAAVFCNENDELCVVDRQGRVELLQVSSFASRLDLCVVYLDEQHTRGIDIKLPIKYRAAVTLGASLTKDRLVQAAMRMRKLGKGQTVVFCVPAEITTKIRETLHMTLGDEIGVREVLRWVISETHAETRHSMTLWAHQNHRFNIQQELWEKNTINGKRLLTTVGATEFLEPEARDIQFRYQPRVNKKSPLLRLDEDPRPRSKEIVKRCQKFGMLEFNARKLTEEQERELNPEVDIDAERVVQKPPHARPLKHVLRDAVVRFVQTGVPEFGSPAYIPAFEVLRKTTAGQHFDISQLGSSSFLATTDFAKTVVNPGTGSLADSYQRSVQWILSARDIGSHTIKFIMIISPFEAQGLMGDIFRSSSVALHLYRARQNLSHISMDRLDFHTISPQSLDLNLPPALSVQLNIFAGQPYFSSYQDYRTTCAFLGLASGPTPEGWTVAADGFIECDAHGQPGGPDSRVRTSPVNFLKLLMSKIRRGGRDVAKTHVGKLVEGRVLTAGEFEGGDDSIFL
jgi:hypothetical protein